VIGESISNDVRIVLVHNIVLVVACSEDDSASYCDSYPNEWGGDDILVVYQDRVNTAECQIRDGQPFSIGSLVLNTIGIISIATLEVAYHLPFCLWIFGRYEFRRRSLRLAGSRLDGFPSTSVDSW
jgi:hypothetical protein